MNKHLILSDFLTWITILALEITVLITVIRYRISTKIPTFPLYLIFVALYGVAMAPVAFLCNLEAYCKYYYTAQGALYILHISTIMNLLRTVRAGRPWHRVVLGWSLLLMTTIAVAHYYGHITWQDWLHLAMWCDIAVWSYLVWGLIYAREWRYPYSGIAFGFALMTALHLFMVFCQGYQDPTPLVRFGYQCATISGLSIWIVTVRKRQNQPLI